MNSSVENIILTIFLGYVGLSSLLLLTEGNETTLDGKHWKPQADAEELKNYLKDIQANANAIIKLVAYRTQDQRLRIKSSYGDSFDGDLGRDSSWFSRCLAALFRTPAENYAVFFQLAIGDEDQKIDRNPDLAMLIIASLTEYENLPKEFTETFKNLFGKEIKDAIKEIPELKKDVTSLCMEILEKKTRKLDISEDEIDVELAQSDSQNIIAESGDWKDRRGLVDTALITLPFKQLERTLREMENEIALKQLIEEKMDGNKEKMYLQLVAFGEGPVNFFGQKLLDHIGDESQYTNILIIATQVDTNLVKIDIDYPQLYFEIKRKVKEVPYRDLLLELMDARLYIYQDPV